MLAILTFIKTLPEIRHKEASTKYHFFQYQIILPKEST